jgi:K+-transporting ATPase ATPase B chain
MSKQKKFVLMDPALVKPAVVAAFAKLDPRVQWRNPVMFVVYIGSILTTLLWLQSYQNPGKAQSGFILAVAVWLWFTVLFANFAEAMAEGRSKAQAALAAQPQEKQLGQETGGTAPWHPMAARAG